MPLEKTQKKGTQTTRDAMIDEAIRRTRELMEGRKPAEPETQESDSSGRSSDDNKEK